MNNTQKIYNDLFHDLSTKQYSLESYISREYKCSNGIGVVYSVRVKSCARALAIPVGNEEK